MPVIDAIVDGMMVAAREEGDAYQLVEVGDDILAEQGLVPAQDLMSCGSPYRMTRNELIQQILLPALRNGDLPRQAESRLVREAEQLPMEDLQEWAGEVLRSNPWPPGFYLPSFKEFVESPEYLGDGSTRLTPRQRRAIEDSIGVDARDWFVTPRKISTVVLCWGKGCLSAEEQITDYRTGQTRTVAEWARLETPMLVRSRDRRGREVYREASPVYLKGKAPLFRVTLRDGRSFRATAEHRCLTLDGWRRLRELGAGSAICVGASTGSLSCVPRSEGYGSGTTPNSLVGCHPSPRSCGEPPLRGPVSGQGWIPSLGGARAHTLPRSHKGGQDAGEAHTHLHPLCAPRLEGAYQVAAPSVAAVLQRLTDADERFPAPRQTDPPVHSPSGPPDTSRQQALHQTLPCCAHPFTVSPEPLPQYAEITSIEPDGEGDFYDLTVEGTACYFDAKGILHHNSGKDWLSSCVIGYAAWAISFMRNPWFHFKMPMGEILDILNVAQDKDSAERVFFAKLKNVINKACFAPLLDQQKDITADAVIFRKPIPGEMFPRVCVRINSLHSGNEKAEGRNTLMYIMDEADALRDSTGHGNARKMFSTLTTSNRFESKQLGFVISYPRAKNGFVFEMLDRCGNRGGTIVEWYGDLAATYEVLPWKTYMPIMVGGVVRWTNPGGFISAEPDSEMARLYREDIEDFRAKFACEPPAAEDAFISMPEKIDEAVVPYAVPVAMVEHSTREELDPASGEMRRYVGLALTRLSLRRGLVYFLGGDAGETQDSFTLCLSHVVPENEHGYCSPDAWRDPKLRHAKHYRPEALPDDPNWKPSSWKCDHTGLTPVRGRHDFWGVCRPSGRKVMRQVQLGETPEGDPIYQVDTSGAQVVEEVYLPRVVEDLLLEWKPDRGKRMPVDFRNVRDIILLISQHCHLGMCLFDRWQATALIQDLRAAGIPAESKSFSNQAQVEWYRNYKTLIYNNQVELLPGEDKARRQLRELQLINGNKIDHPKYAGGGGMGGKDLTDAEALSFWLCSSPQYAPGLIDTGNGLPYKGMAAQAAGVTQRTIQQQSIVHAALTGRV